MRAKITYKNGDKEVLKGLTEIHYGFNPGRIAFDDYIKQLGLTTDIKNIKEIEIFNK
jgi:hypothetical protein